MAVSCKINGLEGIREYLGKLLEEGVVDEILVPKLNSAGNNYVQALISSKEFLKDINPFVPVIPIQTGRIAKNLTFTKSGRKLLIIAKPCEIKAIVELTKFQQVNLDDCFLIAVDCPGTYEVNDFFEIFANNSDYVTDFYKKHSDGNTKGIDNFLFRKSCLMCDVPSVDINLVDGIFSYFGANGDIYFIAKDDSELAKTIENENIDLSKREEVLNKIKDEKNRNREEILSKFRNEVNSLEALQNVFSKCIRCHNCMVACPICYCKECVFRSPTFDHSADMITRWAERKGALRMLENTLMFHLTRLNHMSSSCIGCGLCSSACPNDIDVATVFISVADNVQKMLEYKAGMNFTDPAPVTTFREKELVQEAGTNE